MKDNKLLQAAGALFAALFPVIFIFSNNAGEANIADALKIGAIIFIISAVIFLIALAVYKSITKALFAAAILMIIGENYIFIERFIEIIFKSLKYWHIAPVVIAFLVFVLFKTKTTKEEVLKQFNLVISIVFVSLSVFNIVLAVPKFLTSEKAELDNAVISQAEDINFNNKELESLPNIYFLAFDEFSSFSTIKSVYNYDNIELEEFLLDKNFSLSYTSHNESYFSNTVFSNLLNLDYIANDGMLATEKDKMIQQARLFDIIKGFGYKINVANIGTSALKNDYIYAEKNLIKGGGVITFEEIYEKNTIFYPFFVADTDAEAELVLNGYEYIKDSKDIMSNGLFTYSHVLQPHQPFIFDAEGNRVRHYKRNDWEDKSVYLNQYIFTTHKIMELVDNILESDPGCIIILQSDHSARGGEVFSIPTELKTSILNAVYFKGEKIDIEGLSGLNTLRKVLNMQFNCNYEMLEVKQS